MEGIKRGWPIIIMPIFLICRFSALGCAYAGEEVLNVDQVIKNTDPATATRPQIKEYFGRVKGKQAKGEGVVVNVLPPRIGSGGMPRITILTAASKPEEGYNVVLLTRQREGLTELKMNDRIAFEGTLHNISLFMGVSVDLIGSFKQGIAAPPPAVVKSPPSEEVLTNAAIIDMTKAQLGESTITAKIKSCRASFDLSVEGLIALKNAGVSDKVIEAMVERQRTRPPSISKQRARAGGEPPVDVDEAIKKLESLQEKETKNQWWTPQTQSHGIVPEGGYLTVVVTYPRKEYADSIRGKFARGCGAVASVIRTSEGKQKITILTPASNLLKGYSVVLVTDQPESTDLRKDDRVCFEGKISDVSKMALHIQGRYEPEGE